MDSEIVRRVGSSIGIVTLITLTIIVILYVVFHIYNLLTKTALTTTTVTSSPIKVSKTDKKVINASTTFGSLINGKEYSYSFWMYINSIDSTVNNKHIISRGASPMFLLDNQTNKLKVMVGIVDTPQIGSDGDYMTLTIDYVPLQRWVNIVCVMDNDFITLYMDGEIYNVANLLDATSSGQNKIISSTSGDMHVGQLNPSTPGFDGYISKVQFFNYALTIDHARIIYNAGPVGRTILSAVGLPLYGIRNPFYKVDTLEEIEGLS